MGLELKMMRSASKRSIVTQPEGLYIYYKFEAPSGATYPGSYWDVSGTPVYRDKANALITPISTTRKQWYSNSWIDWSPASPRFYASYKPAYWLIQFSVATQLKTAAFQTPVGYANRQPSYIDIYGSNDGSNWVNLGIFYSSNQQTYTVTTNL